MNYILIIVGIIICLIGIGTFFNTTIERLINLPGSPRFKAVIATIVGLILIIAGFMYQ
jgi:hypothetical protein